MPTWLIALLMGAPMIIDLLKGGSDQQTQTQTTVAPPTGYQSPSLGLLDLLMQGTLGKNLSLYGGAGMPGGQTIAPSYLQDFLDLIGSSYTDLQGKYQAEEKKVERPATRESVTRKGLLRSYGNYAGR
uniref:Uncharacterized protein n=1 Tax=viral metagenome TaxID=1070528 RepID=A0A6M3IYJ2_9ZZZZ